MFSERPLLQLCRILFIELDNETPRLMVNQTNCVMYNRYSQFHLTWQLPSVTAKWHNFDLNKHKEPNTPGSFTLRCA